jgi:hypothetical protein
MRWRRVAFGGIALLAMVFGLSLLFVPRITAGPVAGLVDAVETVGSERVLFAAGLGLIASLGVALRSPGTGADQATRRSGGRIERDAGGPTTGHQRITASELDEGIEAAIDDGGEPMAVLRDRLRTTAASVYADVMGVPESEARAAVAGGEWCRDELAAAFLASPDGPGHSLSETLRLLVVPRRERRRRIERTITAIEELEYA